MKRWNYITYSDPYSSTLFKLPTAKNTALLPRWHESESWEFFQCRAKATGTTGNTKWTKRRQPNY